MSQATGQETRCATGHSLAFKKSPARPAASALTRQPVVWDDGQQKKPDTKSVCSISAVHVGADRAVPGALGMRAVELQQHNFLNERWIELAPVLLGQLNAPRNVVGGLAKAQKRGWGGKTLL